MEMTCPACRKSNVSAPQCSRCGADLSDLVQIRKAADLALTIGYRFLEQRDGSNALCAAQSAWHLTHSAAAAQLAFLACLQKRQWNAAGIWYQRAANLPGPRNTFFLSAGSVPSNPLPESRRCTDI